MPLGTDSIAVVRFQLQFFIEESVDGEMPVIYYYSATSTLLSMHCLSAMRCPTASFTIGIVESFPYLSILVERPAPAWSLLGRVKSIGSCSPNFFYLTGIVIRPHNPVSVPLLYVRDTSIALKFLFLDIHRNPFSVYSPIRTSQSDHTLLLQAWRSLALGPAPISLTVVYTEIYLLMVFLRVVAIAYGFALETPNTLQTIHLQHATLHHSVLTDPSATTWPDLLWNASALLLNSLMIKDVLYIMQYPIPMHL